jgi:hypothetical protein
MPVRTGRCSEAGAGVGPGFGAERAAVVVEALERRRSSARPGRVRIPGDDEAATGHAGDGRLVLVAAGAAVDEEGLAHLQAAGVVALAEQAGAAVAAALVTPHDHEAAAVEAGHHRLGLVVGCVVVDLELVAHRDALGVVALAVDAVAPAVLGLGRPHGDVAAVAQAGHGGLALVGRGVGVDQVFGEQGWPPSYWG